MSTITLYANKVNRMPGLLSDAKKAVKSYKSDLTSLKSKVMSIDRSVCNVDNIISTLQSSTQTQEQKITSLENFKKQSDEFIADTVRADNNVADVVEKRKDDFYDKFSYLKPECEKDWKEKTKDWFASVGAWCKKNWVAIVTVVVVIAVAAIAAVCGVAIACIAAVAGIISLALCVADVICMIVTGGKDISTLLRENGFDVLAQIFQGVSIGADIVSIAFPAGAAIKTMAKVGVKTFAEASLKTAKAAFKETIEKVFKSGFKDGVKNFGKIVFKTFVVDIDDLKNWKAVPLKMNSHNKHWIENGDQLIPNPNTIPGKNNPNKLSMEDLMKQSKFNKFPDTIPWKNGEPDLSKFSVFDADISMKNLDIDVEGVLNGTVNSKQFSGKLRDINFKNADASLKKAFDDGLSKYATKADFEKALGFKLTWHEDLNMKKCWLVPTEIHANIGHTGGVGNYKFNFKGIPDKFSLTVKKLEQISIINIPDIIQYAYD